MDHGELGRKLRDVRRSQGLTLRELARRSENLTNTGVSKIERGERWPNLLTLQALAQTLNASIIITPYGVDVQRLVEK